MNKQVLCTSCMFCRCRLPVNNAKCHSKKDNAWAYGRISYNNTEIFCEKGQWIRKEKEYIHKSGLASFMDNCQYAKNKRFCPHFKTL